MSNNKDNLYKNKGDKRIHEYYDKSIVTPWGVKI